MRFVFSIRAYPAPTSLQGQWLPRFSFMCTPWRLCSPKFYHQHVGLSVIMFYFFNK